MNSFLNSWDGDHSQNMCLELWAGIECTVNRVHDRYYDQIEQSGYVNRFDDLDRVAALGVRALRYPILWERFAPEGSLQTIDWSWADERLLRLRDLGVRPIVGLVHHGSGPRHTSLTAPDFAEGLAEHARRLEWPRPTKRGGYRRHPARKSTSRPHTAGSRCAPQRNCRSRDRHRPARPLRALSRRCGRSSRYRQ